MGFRMKITGGAEPITFDERSILKVDFDSASAKDSNARATDYGLSVRVWGKMLYKLGGEGDDATLGLAQWSQVPSEKADCYRWSAGSRFPMLSWWSTARKWMMRAVWEPSTST